MVHDKIKTLILNKLLCAFGKCLPQGTTFYLSINFNAISNERNLNTIECTEPPIE